jgi:ribosome-associated protein
MLRGGRFLIRDRHGDGAGDLLDCVDMSSMTAEQFAVELSRLADDNKCTDVTVMDLRGRSSVADFFVICSGTSDRQMRSTADAIVDHAKKLGSRVYGRNVRDSTEWILLDFVDVVVHIFIPTTRRYYDLELLWGDAPRVSWERSATA